MVLYETTYNDDICNITLHEQVMIGLGGTTTLRLKNGKAIDLIDTCINYNLKTITGRSYHDIKLGFEKRHAESITYGLEEIAEILFEGFIITNENRNNILKLIHGDIVFTKIPKRD